MLLSARIGEKMKEKQLEELLGKMSRKEKINQLLQVTTGFFAEDALITGPLREGGITEENIKMAGSVIGLLGAKKFKEIQKNYMEVHPHHIPIMVMLDVINGFRTVFPIPLAQGATFEPELSKRCAQIAAKEAAVSGVHVTFAPMVDMVRDARWGRVMESTGEDPLLNSHFAAAMVKGFQGEEIGEQYRVSACIKHFAAYGAPEAGREYNTVELSENTLREYYLPAYKAGIDAGAEMVMTSFNTLNGVPSTGNEWLMRSVLREEMGFEGILISDWAAIEELRFHGYAENRAQAAMQAMKAGVDIDMMTGIYSKELDGLLESGMLSDGLLEEAVLRILKLKNKLGLFENPYKDASEEEEKKYILCKEHRETAREAAEKSFVLLKNEDSILPFRKKEKIAFIGPFVEEAEIYGAWSMMGRAEDTVSIQRAAREYCHEYELSFAKGAPVLSDDESVLIPNHLYKSSEESITSLRNEAILTAQKADKVILALGEHRCMSGEAASRGSILLPKVQRELLEAVRAVNENIVLVLFTGRPLELSQIEPLVKGILTVWMPGTEGGTAIMNILSGKTAPSGKLPMCFPYCVGQVPIHYNEYYTGRPYEPETGESAYRSNYRDMPNAPLYPFGYGLTYTSFSYKDLRLDHDILQKGETIKASVCLVNTGSVEGSETVQLYTRDCVGSVVRPKKELKAYEKVTLQPGESKEVVFHITEEMLRFVRADGSYGSEPGEFKVFIGPDSSVKENVSFCLRA